MKCIRSRPLRAAAVRWRQVPTLLTSGTARSRVRGPDNTKSRAVIKNVYISLNRTFL